MDPLSITASTLALGKLCTKVLSIVIEFSKESPNVDLTVANLCRGLNSLSQVLKNVGTAWSENPLVAVAQTGPDGNLWVCVKDSVGNCEEVLKRLESALNKISAEDGVGRGFMRKPVKQLRLNMSKKDIQGFESEVQTYERALSIAFHAINACAAIRRDHTDAEVSKRLETIETGIQDLSKSLNDRQASGSSSMEATKNFEQFLQAANKFKTSASTVVNGDASTIKGGLETQYGGSIFGDTLSDDRYEIIQSWIQPPSPLGVRGSAPNGSNLQTGHSNQSSLPELMAVLETVTQLADQYRNSEAERNSTKDEQLRSLEMDNRALEQKLEKTIALAEKQRQDLKGREDKLKKQADDIMDAEIERSYILEELKKAQRTAASMDEERDNLAREIHKKDAAMRDLELQKARMKEKLEDEIMGQEDMITSLAKEKQALQATITAQAQKVLEERAKIIEGEKALGTARAEVTSLNISLLGTTERIVKAQGDITGLEKILDGYVGQNHQLKVESENYRNEAESLRDEFQQMRRDLTSITELLDQERRKVEDWETRAVQYETGKRDSEKVIKSLTLDLETSTFNRKDLENRLRGESEDFMHQKSRLERQLYDVVDDLSIVARLRDDEKLRADRYMKILTELTKLQEQQVKLLSDYKAPTENIELPQPKYVVATNPAPQATRTALEISEARTQQEKQAEVIVLNEENKNESLTKVDSGTNPAKEVAITVTQETALKTVKQKETKPQEERKTKKKSKSIWKTDRSPRKPSLQYPDSDMQLRFAGHPLGNRGSFPAMLND